MVRRASSASFVAGGFVFPGGAVDACDRTELAAEVVVGASSALLPFVAAALRETFEETGMLVTVEPADVVGSELRGLRGEELYRSLAGAGVHLDGGRLALLSRWVGPPMLTRRFDTRFFVAEVDATQVRPDGVEVTEAVWVEPAEALIKADSGDWSMIFPTRKHLELLARFEHPSEAVSHAANRRVVAIEPTAETLPDGGVRLRLPPEADSWWSS